MQKITNNQIEGILENYLQNYHDGKFTHTNIMFVGHDNTGIPRVIKKWLGMHADELKAWNDLYPSVLHKINQNGVFEKVKKNGKYLYTYVEDELDKINREYSVVVLNMINWNRDNQGYDMLFDLVKNRSVTTALGNNCDLGNVCMIIATAFPEDGTHHTFSLPDGMMDLFDVYEVQSVLKETAEYCYSKNLGHYNYEDEGSPERAHCKNRLEILDTILKWPKEIKHTALFTPDNFDIALENSDSVESFLKELDSGYESRLKLCNLPRIEDEAIKGIKEIFAHE